MIERVKLENGVRVTMENMPYLRSVAIGVWILAGARNEKPEINGISHFIEHMLFKGTKNRSAMDIADEMDKIGGQMNAYTAKELTCFFARVLDSHFDSALDVLSDMCFNSLFLEEDIVKEKNVVLEEINMYEDTPEDLVHDILQFNVWRGSPLGQPVLGTRDTVKSFSSEDLKKYMREYYRPENVVVSVAGNFDREHVLKKIESYFLKFDCCENYVKPEYPSKYTQIVVTKEKEVEQLHLCMAFPGIALSSDENYTLAALNTIFGGGMSSRLFQNIREKYGLVYSIYSYASSYRETGLFSIYAALNPNAAAEAGALIKNEINTLFSNRISEEQLANTKEQLKSNYMLSLESTSNRMSSLARSEILLDRILTPDQIVEKINQITLDRIYRLADSIFDMKKMSLSVVGKLAQANIDSLLK